jgi:hypothetical protein
MKIMVMVCIMSGGCRMHFGKDIKIKVEIVLITKNRGRASEAKRSVHSTSFIRHLKIYIYMTKQSESGKRDLALFTLYINSHLPTLNFISKILILHNEPLAFVLMMGLS